MRRCLKQLLLSLFAALFGIFMLSGPVFASPADNTTPTTSEEAPANDTTATPTETEQTDAEQPSCYDEVGGIGWLVCPGTGFLANVIDGAYGIIEQLIRVDPLPTDSESPIFVVWSYIKSITNAVFVIFLLVVIYSQLTGLGITNYGIKRTLPRLIIAAIAVNLSYIICTLAVDLSNVIGGGFLTVFDNILNNAMHNSQISDVASSASVAGVVATILGIGATGAVLAMTFAGGIAGVLWVLIPVVLSGAVAVISAVITMAARQALIILLAMISPLAIVCCLLPNTERWFQRWKQIFLSMIIFYPLFSILYGASRLAGLVIITSANNWLTVVLGIAVQILPLFLSIPLLRMSNTMLGRIDGMLRRGTAPVTGFAHRYSHERQALARQRQLSGTGRLATMPHNRLARYLEQRRINRDTDLREAVANNEDTFRTRASGRSYFRSNGKLNRRGLEHYAREEARFENSSERTLYAATFDQGFGASDDDNRIPRRYNKRINQVNERYSQAIVNDSVAAAYANSVKFENMENRANTIKQGMQDRNSRIYAQVMSTFNATDSGSQQKAVSAVVSEAINAKARVDREAKENYATLFNDFQPGDSLTRELENAIDNYDYNAMVASLQTMAMRGDHDKIGSVLRAKSAQLNGTDARSQIMQKELRDTLIRMKADDANLWAWAKANMIRTAMNAGGVGIASYIDYESFMAGNTVAGDTDQGAIRKTNSDVIIQGITDSGIAKGQDRTIFADILDMQRGDVITQQNGKLSTKFSIKQLRSAATSGAMDGEQLDSLNNLLTGGIQKYGANDAWIQNNRSAIIDNIVEFVGGMSASQLASTKTATIVSLNDALMQLDPSDVRTLNGHQLSGRLADALTEQSAALCRPNAVTDRNKMNAVVREMLGIEEINPNGPTHRPGGTQNATRI